MSKAVMPRTRACCTPSVHDWIELAVRGAWRDRGLLRPAVDARAAARPAAVPGRARYEHLRLWPEGRPARALSLASTVRGRRPAAHRDPRQGVRVERPD